MDVSGERSATAGLAADAVVLRAIVALLSVMEPDGSRPHFRN
jgi:hypothetical protein